MHAFDRQTDGQTEISSLDRVCIACSAVKITDYELRNRHCKFLPQCNFDVLKHLFVNWPLFTLYATVNVLSHIHAHLLLEFLITYQYQYCRV